MGDLQPIRGVLCSKSGLPEKAPSCSNRTQMVVGKPSSLIEIVMQSATMANLVRAPTDTCQSMIYIFAS